MSYPQAIGPVATQTGEIPGRIQSFLRWAGGKQLLVHRLLPYLPADVRKAEYWEPFLGAGSLFLAIQPEKSFLSDANPHLIWCYEYIQESPDLVADYVRRHAALNGKRYYYRVRTTYNGKTASAAQAARFIYLNRTCFNGIFRVNTQGYFNVPYGYKKEPLFPGTESLRLASQALRGSSLAVLPFEVSMDGPSSGSFVYLDPPYPPLNGTSYFAHYTMDRFSELDQRRLAECASSLDRRGVKFMMSNADTPTIRKLYKRFNTYPLEVRRSVSCKTTRHMVSELVITNYEVAP